MHQFSQPIRMLTRNAGTDLTMIGSPKERRRSLSPLRPDYALYPVFHACIHVNVTSDVSETMTQSAKWHKDLAMSHSATTWVTRNQTAFVPGIQHHVPQLNKSTATWQDCQAWCDATAACTVWTSAPSKPHNNIPGQTCMVLTGDDETPVSLHPSLYFESGCTPGKNNCSEAGIPSDQPGKTRLCT